MNSRTAGSPGFTKSVLSKLRTSPLHPQWFAFFREDRNLRNSCAGLKGLVTDIGCADSKPRQHLPPEASYIGIDYYATARDWYGTRPDLFADARSLPLADNSVDHTLLLDVLEHIPDPELCLAEIHRTLKPGGSLTIQVPFLYPVHDAPLDFHRWTRFGLARAAQRHGFRVEQELVLGHPLESAALNANIALSKTALNWLHHRNILGLTALLLPVVVLANNLLAWIGARLSKPDELMPYGYRMVWIRE